MRVSISTTLLRPRTTLPNSSQEPPLKDFRNPSFFRSAVVQKLGIIGEAAGRVSEDLTTRHPEVPWPQIVAFRNILMHAYFGIDWDVVWLAATHRCPILRGQIAAILAAELGGLNKAE